MSSFGIGLVAYNMTPQDIKTLSNSIIPTNPIYQVVVDNSPNSNRKNVFEKYGWTYIHNPKNPGFGTSHNIIFEKYSKHSDYHLIVNPDISFSGNVILALINFLEKTPDAGCVMPKVYYPNGDIQRLAKLLPSPIDLIGRRLPFKFINSLINNRLELQHADYQSGCFKVPFVSGCFLLFRSRLIEDIGFFDTRYFMYMEDTDLSRRLCINHTWPYYYGVTSITHRFEKGSAKKLKLFKIHILSAFKYFMKWGWFDRQRMILNKECLDQFR